MLHKVERMLNAAAESGAEIIIVNGSVPGRLKAALIGEDVVGTVISK
jgi:isopentenyl phosphate kinase